MKRCYLLYLFIVFQFSLLAGNDPLPHLETLIESGKWQEAIQFAESLEVQGTEREQVRHYLALGSLYTKIAYGLECDPLQKQAKFDSAKKNYRKALSITKSKAFKEQYLKSVDGLMRLFAYSYQHDSIITVIENEIRLFKKWSTQKMEYLNLLNQRGIHYFRKGRYHQAIKVLSEAFDEFRSDTTNKKSTYGRILMNIAASANALGQEEKADYFTKLSTLYAPNSIPSPDSAVIAFKNKSYTRAIEIYRERIKGYEDELKGLNSYLVGRYLSLIGECYFFLEEFDLCDSLYELGTTIVGCNLGTENRYYTGMLSEHGYYLIKMPGKLKKAQELLLRAKEIHLKKYNEKESLYLSVLSHLIESYSIGKQWDQLESELENFYQTIYRVVRFYLAGQSEKNQINYLRGLEGQIGKVQYHYLKHFQHFASESVISNYNFNYFLKDFAGSRMKEAWIRSAQDSINKEYELFQAAKKLRIDLAHKYSNGSITDENFFLDSTVVKLEQIESQIFALTQIDFRIPPDYNPYLEIRNNVKNTFIDFYYVIKRQEFHPDTNIYFAYTIRDGKRPELVLVFSGQKFDPVRAQQKITEFLIEEINPNKPIFIAPAHQIWTFSFESLRNKQGEFLLDKGFQFCYLNSGKDLLSIDKIRNPETTILIAGNPAFDITQEPDEYSIAYRNINLKYSLPGTAKEVNFIKDLAQKYRWKYKTIEKSDATETEIKRTLENNDFKFIHFATHGIYSLSRDSSIADIISRREHLDPLMESGLFFLDSKYDDGFLNAYELANYDYNQTELVVLSACQSGMGDLSTYEGVLGMQRVFRILGVPNLLVSLWDIPDMITSEFMKIFYQNLARERSYFQSFTTAQRKIRSKYEDPKLWSGIIYIGSDIGKFTWLNWKYLLPLAIPLLVLLFAWMRIKQKKFVN